MKTCSKCGAEKHPKHFSKDKYKKDGLNSQCKDCRSGVNSAWFKKHYADETKRQKFIERVKRNQKEKLRMCTCDR